MIKLLIIAGPSAVGKSTLAECVLEKDKRFSFLRSVTTRAPRGDGRDSEYLYLSRGEFLESVARGEILEHTEYAGTLYGTPRSEVLRVTREGRIPLLVLDLEGVRSLSLAEGISPCALYVYDGLSVMEERLRLRFVDSGAFADGEQKLKSRLDANLRDYRRIADYSEYFYSFVPNDSTVSKVADVLLVEFSDFDAGYPRKEVKESVALNFISRNLAENAEKSK